jgi:hypothetical protein
MARRRNLRLAVPREPQGRGRRFRAPRARGGGTGPGPRGTPRRRGHAGAGRDAPGRPGDAGPPGARRPGTRWPAAPGGERPCAVARARRLSRVPRRDHSRAGPRPAARLPPARPGGDGAPGGIPGRGGTRLRGLRRHRVCRPPAAVRLGGPRGFLRGAAEPARRGLAPRRGRECRAPRCDRTSRIRSRHAFAARDPGAGGDRPRLAPLVRRRPGGDGRRVRRRDPGPRSRPTPRRCAGSSTRHRPADRRHRSKRCRAAWPGTRTTPRSNPGCAIARTRPTARGAPATWR